MWLELLKGYNENELKLMIDYNKKNCWLRLKWKEKKWIKFKAEKLKNIIGKMSWKLQKENCWYFMPDIIEELVKQIR